MPELPEVETVVREVRPHLQDHCITAVRASRKRLRRPWSPQCKTLILGQRITSVGRRGKWILCRLANDRCLVIHLGMSGQLTVVPADEPVASHTHLVFRLDQGAAELRFRDIRRFGGAQVLTEAEVDGLVENSLGPEPFVVESGYWRQSLAATRRCLKAVLLDQRVVAGVGNIYADESLFEARLHPARLACDLRPKEAARLREAIATVLTRAIERRGSSIRNYVGGSGLQGEYQNEFRAYGRTGEPCPRCETTIACIRLAGRSTHYCPSCQHSALSRQPGAGG